MDPTPEELPNTQNVSLNLCRSGQHPNQNQKGGKNITWCVKEDVALISAYISVSEDSVCGKNRKKTLPWARVHQLYHKAQAVNPDGLNPRNIESMKGRFKRLNENVGKWVAALKEANRRKKSGMRQKDVEIEAHTIYEAGGGKFQDLVVYNDVMSKHPRWAATFHQDATQCRLEDDVNDDQESGGSTKRSRTSKDGHYHLFNSKTPTVEGSIISRPTCREKARKKGKGKASPFESEVAAELRAMRLAKSIELKLIAEKHEFERKKLEFERKKLQMNSLNIEKRMLNTLLAKDKLSPEDEELKRRLTVIVFGQI